MFKIRRYSGPFYVRNLIKETPCTPATLLFELYTFEHLMIIPETDAGLMEPSSDFCEKQFAKHSEVQVFLLRRSPSFTFLSILPFFANQELQEVKRLIASLHDSISYGVGLGVATLANTILFLGPESIS